ncbi:hypothetical protein TWF730_003325 [Orbilia blumenaviensis]|uniref:Uncharacterized protein n=1 Tax=Orbilia blumenaviensis TaxID=1796055 RepID=A0AAV9U9E4_9PEZI
MVSTKIIVTSVLYLLAGVSALSVGPTSEKDVEVDYVKLIKPGPGLLFPKELGLTNKDLTRSLPRGIELNLGQPVEGIPACNKIFKREYQCRLTDTYSRADALAC